MRIVSGLGPRGISGPGVPPGMSGVRWCSKNDDELKRASEKEPSSTDTRSHEIQVRCEMRREQARSRAAVPARTHLVGEPHLGLDAHLALDRLGPRHTALRRQVEHAAVLALAGRGAAAGAGVALALGGLALLRVPADGGLQRQDAAAVRERERAALRRVDKW